jgi:hypothetical protein
VPDLPPDPPFVLVPPGLDISPPVSSSLELPLHALATVLANVVPTSTSAARLSLGWLNCGVRVRASASSETPQNGQAFSRASTCRLQFGQGKYRSRLML